jgi:ACT domain-containing protein
MLRMNFNPTTTTVTDAKTSKFNLFPNPTNGFITIELDKISNYELSVINVLGQTVYMNSITDINTSVDLSSFDRGVYTIELSNGNRVYSEKLIIE